MEIEELNELYELHSINEEYFFKAVEEIKKQGKPVTPDAIKVLFEKYNKQLEGKGNNKIQSIYYESDEEDYSLQSIASQR